MLILWISNKIALAVEEAEVTEYYTKVYIAPATNTKCIGFGQKGDRFQILGETDKWYRIQFKDSPGWLLRSQSVKFDQHAPSEFNKVVSSFDEVEVDEDYAKVYIAPAINTKCIGFGQKGDRFKILGETDRWYRIQFKDSPGWLSKIRSRKFDPNVITQHQKSPVESRNDETRQAITSVNKPESQSNTPKQPDDSTSQHIPQQIVSSPETSRNSSFVRKIKESESVKFTGNPEINKNRVQHNCNWFARQSFHKIIPPPPLPQENEPLKYFVVTSTAPVYPYLDSNAPVIGTARSGERLVVINEGEFWCKIAFNDTTAWIQKTNGKIELMNDVGIEGNWIKLVIYGSTILIIAVFIIINSVMIRKNMKLIGFKKNLKKMNVLIVSKKNKEIESTLTDSTTTLGKCFSELGFHVTIAQELLTVRKALDNGVPDILLIDWQFGKDIIHRIEQLFTNVSDVYQITVFVFDHPDPSSACQGSLFQTIFFLGIAFSDTDIFKLITPVITSANSGMNVLKSVKSSALEGEVSQTNLIEVLQFIDIGCKTGCMLIECGDPFAILYFYQGRIIYAQAQEFTGRDAVFRVLNLNGGKFRFLQNKLPETSNVNLSTLEVLMEWTKALDEDSVSHQIAP